MIGVFLRPDDARTTRDGKDVVVGVKDVLLVGEDAVRSTRRCEQSHRMSCHTVTAPNFYSLSAFVYVLRPLFVLVVR